jgi:hypothetical protein
MWVRLELASSTAGVARVVTLDLEDVRVEAYREDIPKLLALRGKHLGEECRILLLRGDRIYTGRFLPAGTGQPR